MVRVFLYSKNYFQTNEVTDFCILQLNPSRKRSKRFHEHMSLHALFTLHIFIKDEKNLVTLHKKLKFHHIDINP